MNKLIFALTLAGVVGSAVAAPKEQAKNPPKAPVVSYAGQGSATVVDAVLDTETANLFVYSSINPNKGPNGNTSGFSGDFASSGDSSWVLVGKDNRDPASGTFTYGSTILDWGYDVTNTASALIPANTSGSFWIKSNTSITLDLALAVHASDASGAWLFDDLTLNANDTQDGTFRINWLNNGGQVPNFSNFTVFARDIEAAKVITDPTIITSPVPEPQTYAMILAALGIAGFAAKRRKQAA